VSILKKFEWNKITFVHTDELELQHTADAIFKVRNNETSSKCSISNRKHTRSYVLSKIIRI